MDTQTQIERLIELAIVQRTELKELVAQLPQLREHLNAEVEKAFEEAEPQLRSELEEWTTKQAQDKTAALGVALETKIAELAKNLEISTQARYNAIIAEREENARLAAQAEQKIAEHAASLPGAVKEIVTAELARFPRAGEIDQLRKEFAEPKSLNPRGKWLPSETYNKLDLVTFNGDSYVSNTDGNRERPSRNAANWTLSAARGMGGGTGFTSLNNVLGDPSAGQIVGSEGGQYVRKTLVAGANITINETASAITIIGDEGQISLQDGTAAAPSLFFTNDTDTGLYRPSANTLGISVSGTQVAYFDENGLTVPSAGVVAGGSIHASNGNANNPSLSFSNDQDTGFFRHQPNELGITLGGVQNATLTSTTFSITPNLVVSGTGSINGTSIPASKTLAVTSDKLSVFASTSSSELAGVISDETGSGALVFATSPTLVTPNIGAATGTSFNLTGSGTLGTTLAVNGSTASSSTTTGALVVTGGTGIGGAANIGGNATVGGGFTAGTNAGDSFLIKGGNPTIKEYGGGNSYFDFGQYGVDTTTNAVLRTMSSGNRVTALTLSGANATLAGNLTVSGTGTSSVAGKLGIGTTAPASLLSLEGNDTGTTIGAGTVAMRLVNLNASGLGRLTEIHFGGRSQSAKPFAAISGVLISDSASEQAGDLSFSVKSVTTATNPVESMRLFANGNLFIGASPTDGGQKLQVAGTAYVSGDAAFAGTVTVGNTGIIKSSASVSVSTSATTIFTLSGNSGANFCFVCGDNGSDGFADFIVTIGGGNAVSVISSSTLYGSPVARTYSTTGTSLKLAMASGSNLNVRTTAIYTAY